MWEPSDMLTGLPWLVGGIIANILILLHSVWDEITQRFLFPLKLKIASTQEAATYKPARIQVQVSDTICIEYVDTLFPKKHQYGDTDTIFLIKIKT
jgi:hypothetical protein